MGDIRTTNFSKSELISVLSEADAQVPIRVPVTRIVSTMALLTVWLR